MIPVDPTQRTTLVLNYLYQPHAFLTARAAFRHLLIGSVKGIDADGLPAPWVAEGTAPSWGSRTVSLYDDQPCMRSAHDAHWPIPTVALLQNTFGYRPIKAESISLRKLFSMYRGTCQYCYEKIPFSIATREHVYPRHLGGTNHDFNLVLACKKCNSEKAHHFPYPDINGNPVKPLTLGSLRRVTVPAGVKMRPEWEPYLHTAHTEIHDHA